MSIWVVDADQIQSYDYNSNILFKNDRVKEFLLDDKKLGIMSPKGFGKTFLLKSKRKISQDAGILCLPKDVMCDILENVSIPDQNDRYLSDIASWVKLWKYAISISILKNCVDNSVENRQLLSPASDDKLTEEIFETDYLRTPCQIVNACLVKEKRLVNIALNMQSVYITRLSVLHTPIHVFIDKVDQALKDNIHLIQGASKMSRGATNASIWTYAQVALMEAAYDIFVHNPHIKVYFGIRSEAYMEAAASTELYLQLDSYVVKLEYSDTDLRNMFNKYVACEKDEWLLIPSEKKTNALKAFFGFGELPHGYVEQIEDPFQYLLRHTLKRPRDIMHICSALCGQELNIETVRHIVNLQAKMILQAYIREIGPFVFDQNAELWDEFWKSVNRNVFSIEYAESICRKMNGIQDDHCEGCQKCNGFKPFSRLYESGLLGVIHNNHVQDSKPKILMHPLGNTRIQDASEKLPQSALYFLHPLLSNKIEMERSNYGFSFDVCKDVIVGDGYPISQQQIDKITKKKKVFVSSPCRGMEEIRKSIRDLLKNSGYEPVLSEEPGFKTPEEDIHSYDYCLDKVLECDSLISIVGPSYGGEYKLPSGNNTALKYYNQCQELKKQIKAVTQKSNDPSISMMEYYIAHCNRIPTYVFVDEKVYDERATYKHNESRDDFKPLFAKDTRVFDYITFITKQDTNNWFVPYEDTGDLIEKIGINFPIEKMYQLN